MKKCNFFLATPYGVVVSVFSNDKHIPKEVEEKLEEPCTLLGLTWQDDADDFSIKVWINPRLSKRLADKKVDDCRKEELDCIVAHEAVHVKQFIEEATSAQLDSETEAYLTSFIFKNIRKLAIQQAN